MKPLNILIQLKFKMCDMTSTAGMYIMFIVNCKNKNMTFAYKLKKVLIILNNNKLKK